tara:strand:- start:957 stop:1607 length:651 start_codon:yes stop_codon:yes gene_type:complete
MGAFSRIIALLLILLLFNFILIISLFSFLFQGSPIFFQQKRVGHKLKIFYIYKFRTMRNNSRGNLITMKNDNRITKWGKILRWSKIDEFPQLINILKGEMRFVGPRPEVEEFAKKIDFSFLNKIKPGLTDFSSILFRNESSLISNKYEYNKILNIKNNLSIIYSIKKSFFLDLFLVALTIFSIFFPKKSQAIILVYIKKLDLSLSLDIKKYFNNQK